jgi:peptide subunit release factor 1 (eRF1)
MNMGATHAEVMERAMEIGEEAEKKREQRLLDAVITGAAKGRGGVLGLGQTSRAIHEGRVQTLLISEGFKKEGFRCLGCGFIAAQKTYQCKYCGQKFEKIPDAVESSVRRVLQDGGEVEVLHANPTLQKHGDIGGILRY